MDQKTKNEAETQLQKLLRQADDKHKTDTPGSGRQPEVQVIRRRKGGRVKRARTR